MKRESLICPTCDGKGKIADPHSESRKIGKRLRKLREVAKLRLEDVADKMDITKAYLGMLETGKRDWTSDLEARFAQSITQLTTK